MRLRLERQGAPARRVVRAAPEVGPALGAVSPASVRGLSNTVVPGYPGRRVFVR